MGNVEMHDLAPVRDDERKELNLSRRVGYKQFIKHVRGEAADACLSELPWSVRDSVSLYERMDISFNCITEIPVELPLRLPHLSHLNLGYNQLTTLPESFGLFFHLKTVLLNNNKIKTVPTSLVHLVHVERLDLSCNCLRELPEEIDKMESLKKLNVSNNKLRTLPVSLGHKLTILLAQNNRLKFPAQSICDESSQAALEFLKRHCPTGIPTPVKQLVNVFPRSRGNQLLTSVTNPHSAQAQYIQSQTNTMNTQSRIKTPLLPPLGATPYDSSELKDKILGMFYGAAIGDAIGIATENMHPDEVLFHYDPSTLTYAHIVRDEHRVRWRPGDWTIDFDQLVLVMESVIHWGGVVDELDFAQRLSSWTECGFKELGDAHGFEVSDTVTKVVNNPQFLTDPHGTASQLVASKPADQPDMYTDNGAVARSLALGVVQFHDKDEVVANAIRVCRSTHADPRCVSSAIMVTTIVALMLQGRHNLDSGRDFELLVEEARTIVVAYLQNCFHSLDDIKELDSAIACQDLESVKVSETGKQNNTFKPVAAALAALRLQKGFRPSLMEVILLGGDSSANGCVAGGLLGLRTGYSRLPRDWVEGLRKRQVDWLNVKLNLLLDMMAIP